MEIIYPPLVEEGFSYLLGQKQEVGSKAEFYRSMVKKRMISETGEPTDYAIEQGWIKVFDEAEGLSLENFLKLYPVFQRYDLNQFQQINGFWEIPLSLKQQILQQLSEEIFNYDEELQLKEYLTDR
ncbi:MULTISPECIES: hypothetical protein [Enterococcus]|uniref:Uncharacterized protein n=1 Tax=Candidatus Enterococcus ferrettii TaxID=2815324 RepID=A0ABV0ET03_9ENTE|nr:hypothetical protein [Enterococcus sp. 665A]MBO1341059.1 hypothetical protein [Enterococcus sp. 665A]